MEAIYKNVYQDHAYFPITPCAEDFSVEATWELFDAAIPNY